MSRWYHSANGHVDMPVIWTKKWGVGRVYYNSLGHHADVIESGSAFALMRRGLLWAAAGKQLAIQRGQDASLYTADTKNFKNQFVTNSVCMPSRAAWHTGPYINERGV